jgi:hypothetical protein
VTELETKILVQMVRFEQSSRRRCNVVRVSPETRNELRLGWTLHSYYQPRLSGPSETFRGIQLVESLTVRGFEVE